MSRSKGQLQVEFLRQVIAAGGAIAKASFSIEHGLGARNPAYLLTLEQHGSLTLQELPWTPELEEFLLHDRPTQMSSRAEERERFANIIANNLKTVEVQFGRDLSRTVFVEVLGEHSEYDLGQLLAKVPSYPPSRSSVGYHDCRMIIVNALEGLHNTAVLKLGYPDSSTTVQLIGEAIGLVLDECFHISLRAQLFPR